jgi:hypothetical protein
MYDPIGRPRRLTRRGVFVGLFLTAAIFTGIVVVVVRTMPHPQPVEQVSLDELQQMIVPDATQTALIAAMVRTRLAARRATPSPAVAAAPAAPGERVALCAPPGTPHVWDAVQRENAATIIQVGAVLDVPERGQIVALATAMQESQLRNLGDLGARNDHDSLGLFQQRPSMGWGSVDQVMDPVYSTTAFYLALKRVPGWESMAVTVAAQRVQRSAFPYAYAQWETDANALVQQNNCNTL